MLKPKIGIISVIKAIPTCASRGKRIRFWTFTDDFGSFSRYSRVATCYNRASSDAVASSSCLKIRFNYN